MKTEATSIPQNFNSMTNEELRARRARHHLCLYCMHSSVCWLAIDMQKDKAGLILPIISQCAQFEREEVPAWNEETPILDSRRLPSGHVNNCAVANDDTEENCQVCSGECHGVIK